MANINSTVSFVDNVWGVDRFFNHQPKRYPTIHSTIKKDWFSDHYEITVNTPIVEKEKVNPGLDTDTVIDDHTTFNTTHESDVLTNTIQNLYKDKQKIVK